MESTQRLAAEFGPVFRSLAARYFEPVRFPPDTEERLRELDQRGFVVHVMRATAWVNYLYLAWALARRGMSPIRALVNIRPWFTRPWRLAAQRRGFGARLTYARRHQGSALIFLKQSLFGSASGQRAKEDPFPALVAMARKSERPVFLVPELFVWEKWTASLQPGIIDFLFGSPEAPGFLHSVLAFWRNYHRAQFRVGEPIDLRQFIQENPSDSDELIARKVRSSLHHHLARQTRAVFGPPLKSADRVIDETMRDRAFRKQLAAHAAELGREPKSVEKEARKNLRNIAARYHPTVVAILSPILAWVFNRIYDGIDVDERGLERALSKASDAPIVLCPSRKSHVDYLVLAWILWNRGYTVPHVAAGANLSFFPMGPVVRRAGAFFIRRSFKGDKVYTSSFRAYVRKLVHDGVHQEFFIEGGRSRTGKLLSPRLGMLTWQVEAILEGANTDLNFVPVSIDYEKIMESSSYSRELSGGEKKPEDLKALLKTPKVLTRHYGRIHLTFHEPISLVSFMESRGLKLGAEIAEEQKKNLVRALGNRIVYDISRISTVTPQALVSTALLAHRRRGMTSREVADRIGLVRRIAEEKGAPLSSTLRNAPSDPTVFGAIQEAIRAFSADEMIRIDEVKNECIYQVIDERRTELAFYKNTLMNLLVSRSLVALATLTSDDHSERSTRDRALFLSRLFKYEFIYRVGSTFDAIFSETVDNLSRFGLVVREGTELRIAPEAHARPDVEFLANLLRDYLESYLIAALTLREIAEHGPLDLKAFIKVALDLGRAEFLAGRIGTAESLSRTTLENAIMYFKDQQILGEHDRKLALGPKGQTSADRERLVREIRAYL